MTLGLRWQLLAVLEGHENKKPLISFSTDGKKVLTTDDETSRVWDGDGKLLGMIECRYAEFSPDGSHVVTMATGNTAFVYQVPHESGLRQQ